MTPVPCMRCNTCRMANSAFSQLDFRKWFDRMQPQTVAIATWLLYIDGAYALVDYFQISRTFGWCRSTGGIISILALICALAYPAAGFLMANGKKLGWIVGLVAAFSPFALRFLSRFVTSQWAPMPVIPTGDIINLMFEVALPALLLHSMSRNYVKTWLR